MEENLNKMFAKQYRNRLNDLAGTMLSSDWHVEMALCHMLTRFAEEIPLVTSERFHKTFRQNDVVDFDAPEGTGGDLDMVFWNLLHCGCCQFWILQEAFVMQAEAREASQRAKQLGLKPVSVKSRFEAHEIDRQE